MASPNDIIEIVNSYIGDSLVNKKDDLAELIARGVDDPAQIVMVKTNCAVFALGVWCLVGVQHDLLKIKYQNGMAIVWVRKIAQAKGALRTYKKDGLPIAGSLMHYYTPNRNDNHVEFLLEDPNDKHFALHAGGGRDKNEIGSGTSDITWSWQPSRKLQEWIDPVALLADSPDFSWNK
jgi:hypothetical protein